MADEKLLAQCGCGKLKVELDGVTASRFLCCCSECQRRSGAPFSVSWYYDTDTARHLEGDYGTFPRVGTKGTHYNFHFCTSCGSSVFWTVDNSKAIGVAAGCVPASHHVPPIKAVWVGARADWVDLPTNIPWHGEGTSSAVVREAD